MLKDRICKYCSKQFKDIHGRIFANHVRWCDKNIEYDKQRFSNKASQSAKKINNKIHGQIKQYNVKCNKCNKDFKIKQRQKKFPSKNNYYCSKFCAKSYRANINKEKLFGDKLIAFKLKLSIISKRLWQDENYRNMILPKIQKRFTSKDQRFIRSHFIQNFKNDQWTFGGLLGFNEQRMSRDLYSNKLKICFEYDGIWHFKNIHNQLQSKQLKDKALQAWCISNNYRLVRVSQDWFMQNNKQLKLIQDLIYKRKDPIIKMGKEYGGGEEEPPLLSTIISI